MHIKNGVAYYGKDVEALDIDGILSEMEWMQSYFDSCERDGQGISTKEAVYFRKLKTRLTELSPEKVNYF